MVRCSTLLRAALVVLLVLVATGAIRAQSSVLFADSFEDGNATDWQTFTSGWSEAGGLRLARNTAPVQPVASVWPLGYDWSDYAVEGDVRVLDERTVSQSALVFRFNSPFPHVDYCQCGFFHGVPNAPGFPSGKYLRLVCNGADTVTPFNFSIGRFYRLRATAVGRTLTCEIVDSPQVPRLVARSDSIGCTGTAGLRSTHIRSDYDNFLVTAIAAPPDPSCLDAPIADAGPDQTLEAGDGCTALATLDGSGSIARPGEELLYEWTSSFGSAFGSSPEYQLPLGSHELTLTVTGTDGASDTDTTTVSVVDAQAPTIDAVQAEPGTLWPPNHQMIDVGLSVQVTDNCDPSPSCRIVEVASNEADDGRGDGHSPVDWEIGEPLGIALRAERSGTGEGRIYTVQVECTDASGNSSLASTEVRVAHDQRGGK